MKVLNRDSGFVYFQAGRSGELFGSPTALFGSSDELFGPSEGLVLSLVETRQLTPEASRPTWSSLEGRKDAPPPSPAPIVLRRAG